MHFNVDIGQIIIASMIGIIGWFSNRTINRIEETVKTHAAAIQELLVGQARTEGKVNFLTGVTPWPERRNHER